MHRRYSSRLRFLSAALALCLPSAAFGKDKEASKRFPTKVSGIAIDRGDNWITVKADGEEKAVKYIVDPADKKLVETFKTVFHAARVQLTFKQAGDERQIVSIQRHIIKQSGNFTGEVVKVYGNFWVEVKPKHGLNDAFAPGANYNDKAFMEKLTRLKPGDSVTITYTTDFERHRITTLRINPPKPQKSAAPSSKEDDEKKPAKSE